MAIVYKHIRLDSNLVFYIGIGKSNKRPYSKNHRNTYWHNIVNKHGYKIEIISENITWDEAKEMECRLILEYGRLDLKTGSLVNMTNGGEGISGYSHTEEWKKESSKRNKNKVIGEEQRKIISSYMKNRKITTEFKEKVSIGVKKYFDKKGRKIKEKKHPNNELIWINKDEKNKRVFHEDVKSYIEQGWVVGRFIRSEISNLMSKKGSKWMNNGQIEAMILETEINQYVKSNWSHGRIKRKN